MLRAVAHATRCSESWPGVAPKVAGWDSEGKGRRIGPLLPEEGSHSEVAGVVGEASMSPSWRTPDAMQRIGARGAGAGVVGDNSRFTRFLH
jgi:hypothetical protein